MPNHDSGGGELVVTQVFFVVSVILPENFQ
jgi:hypothetical protein